MSSRPLFIRVALSMVIFAPMFQLGCWRASALVLPPQLFGLHAEEGAAGGRQQDFGQALGALLILQALEDGRVLTVHRQQLDAVLRHGLSHEMAAGDEAFFVGEGEVMAALDGGKACAEARDAHHAVQHHVRAIHRGEGLQPLGAGQELGASARPASAAESFSAPASLVMQTYFGVEFFDLLQNFIRLAVGRQTEHLIPLGADDVEALGADGAGGTQQRDFFSHKALPPVLFSSRMLR